jgi:AraC-like DNA-binding protein
MSRRCVIHGSDDDDFQNGIGESRRTANHAFGALRGTMAAIFSTACVPPAKRFGYWRDAICDAFMQMEVSVPEAEQRAFRGVLVTHAKGRLRFCEVAANAQRVVRSEGAVSRGTTDCFRLMVQRVGLAIVEQGGKTAVMRPGEFALFNGTLPFVMMLPQSFRHDLIEIPGSLLRESIRDPERFCSCTVTSDNVLGRMFLGVLEMARSQRDDIRPAEALKVGDALLALLSGAIGSAHATEPSPKNIELYHRERIRAVVREHLFEPDLCVASIAAEVRLSASYVHRLFSHESKSLSAWIWEQRLEAAHRAVVAADAQQRSITDIAYSVGFKDLAHFSRMFKATFGSSPRALRAQARKGPGKRAAASTLREPR